MAQDTTKRVRPVRIAATGAVVRHGPGGTVYMRSPYDLGPYPVNITERLEYWAARAGDRPFIAQRTAAGPWRQLTYAQTLDRVRHVAQALLDRGLSRDKPVVILSGNSIEHAVLALASMHVGVIYAPIAPAYSLQTREYGTLAQIFERLQPGLVFAAEGEA